MPASQGADRCHKFPTLPGALPSWLMLTGARHGHCAYNGRASGGEIWVGSPQLDWSFANAPEDSGPTDAGPPQTPGPSKPPRRHPSRRLMVGLVGIAAVLGLGAWLFTTAGLLRIQSQLAAEITYEDQRARAGD